MSIHGIPLLQSIHDAGRRPRPVKRSNTAITGLARLVALLVAVALVTAVGMLVAPVAPAGAGSPPPGWTTTEAPLPADAGTNPNVYTASSACSSATSCEVVGWYNDAAVHTWGLIETQNGTSWTDTQAPEPSNAGTGTDQGMWIGSQSCGITTPCHAVSCPSATFCMAVGQYTDNAGHAEPVILVESGGGWAATQAPVPSDAATVTPHAFLRSVTCPSTNFCAAVGAYTSTTGAVEPLLETFDGTTLTVTGQTAPAPGDANTTNPDMLPANVSCPIATSCEAAGTYASTGGTKGLLLDMSAGAGAAWTSMAAPEPADAGTGPGAIAQLFDIACTSVRCTAVGQYRATSGSPAFVVTGTSTTWTATTAPLPPTAATGASTNASLLGISCGAPSACDAVGSYTDTNARSQGLIVAGSGTAWTATQAPQPADTAAAAGQDVGLQAVSCPAADGCMAVGFYVTSAASATGLVVALSGGTWFAMATPLPSNFVPSTTQAAQARVVTCWSVVACTVGGWYPDPGNVQGFLDTFAPQSPPPPPPPGAPQGYWLVASDGGIFSYGNAQFYGSRGGQPLNAPIVGMAATPDNQGYWFVATDGGIFSYGDAGFFGSRGGQPLNKPIVGMAATPDGKGYWLVASDGGIFSYGDAGFFGSTGAIALNKPVVGMAGTPDGKGYWLVASDGGIFNYGDAHFFGSTGAIALNKPVVGMASSITGQGYWLVASDGGIFNYGDAAFFGSTGAIVLNKPVVGMAHSPSGQGYWLVASDGGIFNYGDAGFYGSAGDLALNKPVVGMADG